MVILFLEHQQKNMVMMSPSSTIRIAGIGDIKGIHFWYFGDENGVGIY